LQDTVDHNVRVQERTISTDNPSYNELQTNSIS
jgi:hypothetical protein